MISAVKLFNCRTYVECYTTIASHCRVMNMTCNIRFKYNRATENRKIARKFDNMMMRKKAFSQPRRQKKHDVVFVAISSCPNQQQGAVHPDVRKNLMEMAEMYRENINNILCSGVVDRVLSSLDVTKVVLSEDMQDLIVNWRPSTDASLTAQYEDRLQDCRVTIQNEFDSMLPTSKSPLLYFMPDNSHFIEADNKLGQINKPPLIAGTSQQGRVPHALKPPDILFVQDVYGLKRNAIIQKLLNTHSSITKYGAHVTEDQAN